MNIILCRQDVEFMASLTPPLQYTNPIYHKYRNFGMVLSVFSPRSALSTAARPRSSP